MGETVEFTEEKVREYLDDCIRHWRKIGDNGVPGMPKFNKNIAVYYVDAFQSVRISLFGELLEQE